MGNTVEVANLGLRLVLELATLAALSYGGIVIGGDPLLSVLLGIGLPGVGAMVWGSFVAPRASRRLADPARLVVEIAFFVSGSLAMFLAGVPILGLLLAAGIVVHYGLMVVFRMR